jgi:hypothetical protein
MLTFVSQKKRKEIDFQGPGLNFPDSNDRRDIYVVTWPGVARRSILTPVLLLPSPPSCLEHTKRSSDSLAFISVQNLDGA